MTQFLIQTRLSIRRELFRNLGFLFFSLAMPAGFYLLFTKIFIQGSGTVAKQMALQYMTSMIVYSVLISMIFSFANVLVEDQSENVPTLLAITPAKKSAYYGGLIVAMTLMNVLSVVVIECLAVTVNHASLSWKASGLVLCWTLLGAIPLMLLGGVVSRAGRFSTVSALCNFIVFPMAITSGLWWPLSILPDWMQHIGKLMPTYAVNRLLQTAINSTTVKGSWLLILLFWVAISGIILWGLGHLRRDERFQA
ncbi:ABC transporter permease [Furfurilactobacillus entadae]|uniref:ABC transporter permease n=1 Tax=Furfurilactobacillus entadae TaxID=2922307 RepID=UPI0035EF2FAE